MSLLKIKLIGSGSICNEVNTPNFSSHRIWTECMHLLSYIFENHLSKGWLGKILKIQSELRKWLSTRFKVLPYFKYSGYNPKWLNLHKTMKISLGCRRTVNTCQQFNGTDDGIIWQKSLKQLYKKYSNKLLCTCLEKKDRKQIEISELKNITTKLTKTMDGT